MHRPVARVAALLLGSGFCALVYQVVWLRELRLVFGSSTAASAAVLAIFMGGLGLGSALLGPRADHHPRPLRFYARLELGISLLAFLSPFLVQAARGLYVELGGTMVLGRPLATAVRLLLSALILGAPTFLMGGTLPAAARAVETSGDRSRRRLAILYGLNTLGAVSGVLLANFVLLEALGNLRTLLLASALNGLVATMASTMARRAGDIELAATERAPAGAAGEGGAAPQLTLVVAGAVGFVFLLMELVWYRLLTPLLGGTTFTFGLILATALLGIGLGGVAYGAYGSHRATRGALALTLALEALLMAVPYALGDRLAYLAQLLRPLGALGFHGHVAAWSGVTLLVVFPAAFVAGIQFPLLVALLGEGRERVGRHVGLAYAWNTGGSILGSLAGGFGLIPLLSATGTWVVAVVLLSALGLLVAGLGSRLTASRRLAPLAAVTALFALLLPLVATGPTAVWRHSPVGAGRLELESDSPNALRRWTHDRRATVTWQADGVESSVAMRTADGVAFLINGKTDGHAKGDAGTQVMGGLVGAILHRAPRRAMVIGLGTGSTAGWLAAVPGIEQVDVVELERAVVEVARACAPVNRDVLGNPRVRLIIGDAREALLTSSERYELIFSEPSNPYRAGIASLYTREFYAAAAERLQADGIFMQWLQAYEVDDRTVQTILVTMASVYPHVQVWQTIVQDLLLVASREPISFDVARLRRRVAEEPFSTAMAVAWRSAGVEGLLARLVASSAFASQLAADRVVPINTDDRNRVEFGFARTLGRRGLFAVEALRGFAGEQGLDRPLRLRGEVDWERVADERIALYTAHQTAPPLAAGGSDPARRRRARAHRLFVAGEVEAAARLWQSQPQPAAGPLELLIPSSGLAEAGDEEALEWIERLRSYQPLEADGLLARLRLRQGRPHEAAELLERFFAGVRRDPWVFDPVIDGALSSAVLIAEAEPELSRRLGAALAEPFVLRLLERRRLDTRIGVTAVHSVTEAAELLAALEPWIWWEAPFLARRVRIYAAAQHPNAARARADLEGYLRYDTPELGGGGSR